MKSNPIFKCKCKRQKKYRLLFDGGTTGQYSIELCQVCREKEYFKYLIKEVVII